MRPVGHQSDIQEVEDREYPVGGSCGTMTASDALLTHCIVDVRGHLYTDDEPYWECLVEEGNIYDVGYCFQLLLKELQPLADLATVKQLFRLGALRMCDYKFRVLVFAESQVPLTNPNCTAARTARLMTLALISADKRHGYRRTLPDAADREYGAWKSIPELPGREGQRLRRI